MRMLLAAIMCLSFLLAACGAQVTARGQVQTGVGAGQGW